MHTAHREKILEAIYEPVPLRTSLKKTDLAKLRTKVPQSITLTLETKSTHILHRKKD